MLRSIIELIRLLTAKQQKEFMILQVLVILMAFAEVVGVASIGPFMALIGNIGILQQDNFLADIYRQSGLTSPNDFIVWAGMAALCTLSISAAISIFTLWQLSVFGQKIGVELADRLFTYYLYQPWLFHASGSSSILSKRLINDVSTVHNNLVLSLLTLNAKIVLAAFIIIPVFAFNPVIALSGLAIFATAYFILYQLVRHKLGQNGLTVSQAHGQRYALLGEGFGGIKDVLLLGRQYNFIERFKSTGKQIAYCQGTNQTLTQAPRYLMEVIAYGAVIFLVLYFIKTYDGNLGVVLPTLAVYALAGFKLLPAFQNIYYCVANIKAGLPAFEEIKNDLHASKNQSAPLAAIDRSVIETLPLKHGITLKNIGFTYPGKTIPALSGLNIEIPAKKIVGIVGSTGSGKSTAIDLLLGLIQPGQGELLIDGQPLSPDQLRGWQNTLGFVPQSIYLANSSILENIAFGLPLEQIDRERADNAIKLAHLDELVRQLPEGVFSLVGERGVQLSGGQRQRIGIARSLYHDAEVLIFDEATSALDGITEKIIMDAIHDFSGTKTIIMIAHRFTTVQKCDMIYFMEQGKVVDQGTYNELFERNDVFRKMASHS